MTPPAMLRTGAFARAASLSVKALRLYHETGLLVPAVVDPDTGYRAYAPSQLHDASIIRLLRGVGVSLPEIQAVLDARDLGLVRKVLAEQARRFQASLDAVARLVDDLELDDTAPADVSIRREPSRVVLLMRGNPLVSELESFVHSGMTMLHEAVRVTGAVAASPFGASYPVQTEEDRQDVRLYVALAEPVPVPVALHEAGVRIDELPGCTVAVLEHRGPYAGLDAAYRRLATWVAFHATPTDAAVREWYLTPPNAPGGEPLTELLWPIAENDAVKGVRA